MNKLNFKLLFVSSKPPKFDDNDPGILRRIYGKRVAKTMLKICDRR